ARVDPSNGPALDAFRTNNGVAPGTPIYGPWSGKLENSQDGVELARPDLPQPPGTPSVGVVPYVLVDKVKYQNSPPWPTNLVDGFGASLSRVNPGAYGNDPTNWHSSPKTPGGAFLAGVGPPVIVSRLANTVGSECFRATI